MMKCWSQWVQADNTWTALSCLFLFSLFWNLKFQSTTPTPFHCSTMSSSPSIHASPPSWWSLSPISYICSLAFYVIYMFFCGLCGVKSTTTASERLSRAAVFRSGGRERSKTVGGGGGGGACLPILRMRATYFCDGWWGGIMVDLKILFVVLFLLYFFFSLFCIFFFFFTLLIITSCYKRTK